MRERFKCPHCGLVQWKEAACKRCGAPSEEQAPNWDDPPPLDELPSLDVDAAEPGTEGPYAFSRPALAGPADAEADARRRSLPSRHKPLIVAGVLGVALIAFLATRSRVTVEDYPQQLSFEALDTLCPFNAGTFICQHVQGPDGRVRTIRSASNDDELTATLGHGRFHVRSKSKKIGLFVETRGFNDAVASFLYSAGRTWDFSDEKVREQGSLHVEFGNSGCDPTTVRVYRFGDAGFESVSFFLADILMTCEDGERAVGRVCYNCENVLEWTYRETPRKLKFSRMMTPTITLRDVYRLCGSAFETSICFVVQDDTTKKSETVYEGGDDVRFEGDPESGVSIWGANVRIHVEPDVGETLRSGRYRTPVDVGPVLLLEIQGCSNAEPTQFDITVTRVLMTNIIFEAKCDNDRRVIGRATYRSG